MQNNGGNKHASAPQLVETIRRKASRCIQVDPRRRFICDRLQSHHGVQVPDSAISAQGMHNMANLLHFMKMISVLSLIYLS